MKTFDAMSYISIDINFLTKTSETTPFFIIIMYKL